MPYLLLFLAVAAETVGTTALQASQQFSRLGPSILVVVAYAVSFFLLGWVLKYIPVGVAYAMWSGLGIVFIALIGLAVFGQKLDMPAILPEVNRDSMGATELGQHGRPYRIRLVRSSRLPYGDRFHRPILSFLTRTGGRCGSLVGTERRGEDGQRRRRMKPTPALTGRSIWLMPPNRFPKILTLQSSLQFQLSVASFCCFTDEPISKLFP